MVKEDWNKSPRQRRVKGTGEVERRGHEKDVLLRLVQVHAFSGRLTSSEMESGLLGSSASVRCACSP